MERKTGCGRVAVQVVHLVNEQCDRPLVLSDELAEIAFSLRAHRVAGRDVGRRKGVRSMGFGDYRYSSYNRLTVPLDIGTWECMLLLRREYDRQTWWRRLTRERDASDPWRRRSAFDREEDPNAADQKRQADDERTFSQYLRPNYDLRSITGQAALNEIRSFRATG